MSYKVTRHKTPTYWMGWTKVYVDVLKYKVHPLKAYFEFRNPGSGIRYLGHTDV